MTGEPASRPSLASEVSAARWPKVNWGLLLAIAILAGILALPPFEGLPIAGHRMLAVFGFAVAIWVTDALDYPVSAAVITGLIAILLGVSPDPAKPDALMGTSKALTSAISGFSNPALMLVAAAMFLAAAMTITGLDRRIALVLLSKAGARVSRIMIASILTATVLAFIVPSATARAAAIVPIITGVVLCCGVEKQSRLAGLLMITTVQAVSIWNVGIKTAAAQNMIAVGLIQKLTGQDIAWLSWFTAAAPFSIALSVLLYFVMMTMIPPETKEVPGGSIAVSEARRELGPVTAKEKRLLTVFLVLLAFWATEGLVHKIDSATVTIIAVAILLLPSIGVIDWKGANVLVPWGTIVLFGVGIGLGTVLLQTQAASWLADHIVTATGLKELAPFGIFAVLSAFLIIVHLGFASATALAAAMIPIVISILRKLQMTDGNVVGMTLLLEFVISFGFILPVNSPQGMLAFGTGTFSTWEYLRTGVVLTLLAYALTLVFAATYWRWLGFI
jgi:solute carrier family 13 (sodium-dependent dicarboxylate transporter), member 2/3/5